MKCSMAREEHGDLLIQVTARGCFTVLVLNQVGNTGNMK